MVQGDDVALAWRRSGFDSRWVHSNGRQSDTVGRTVLLRRFPRKGDEGSNPSPSAVRPDGETDDHTSVLTRRSGFESWSGHWNIRAVSSAGQSASMTRWRPQVRTLHRPLRARIRKGYPMGDGTRLESGRAMSLAGSTPAPSAPARAGGFDLPFDGVRGVTAAREPVELEATGSTPAGYPDRKPGGRDHDGERTGSFTGACSWESSEPPRLADRVRLLAPLLLPTWPNGEAPAL